MFQSQNIILSFVFNPKISVSQMHSAKWIKKQCNFQALKKVNLTTARDLNYLGLPASLEAVLKKINSQDKKNAPTYIGSEVNTQTQNRELALWSRSREDDLRA